MEIKDESTLDKRVSELNADFKILVLEVIECLLAIQGTSMEDSTASIEW